MNNNLVGYMINGTLSEEVGTAYTYMFGKNGVLIYARNNHLIARIPVAECDIRGLKPLDIVLELKHGRIPQRLWDLALSVLLAHPEEERYVGIRWTGSASSPQAGCYDLYYPAQDGTSASLTYDCGQDVVFEMHSHPGMGSFFSPTDDKDEQGLKIYGVVGILPAFGGQQLALNLRIGVYGYYHPVKWADIFEGGLGDIVDVCESENPSTSLDETRDKSLGENPSISLGVKEAADEGTDAGNL